VPELGSLGTVRGALGNERPYREHQGDPLGRGAWVRLLRFTCRAADGPVPPEMTRSRPPRLDAVPGHREAAGDNSRGASWIRPKRPFTSRRR
jgi:hypothetical protein